MLVIVSKDTRGEALVEVLWQFVVLIVTIWLPAVVLLSHFIYFFETPREGYSKDIFLAIWYMFSIGNLKKPGSKIWVLVSWLALSFIFLMILADLSSVIAAANSNSLKFLSNSCSTFPLQTSVQSSTCLKDLSSGLVSSAMIGNLEVVNIDRSKIRDYMIKDLSTVQIFNLAYPKGTNLESINKVLQKYWQNQIIYSIYSKYFPINNKNYNNFSLFFRDFYIIFTGISIIVIFSLALLFFKFRDSRNKKLIKRDISEPSPSSRSLLNRPISYTLSLEQSVSSKANNGRPEEWINRAVDINDENAYKFNNIQDYENELSAVEAIHPSISDRSLVSMNRICNIISDQVK